MALEMTVWAKWPCIHVVRPNFIHLLQRLDERTNSREDRRTWN